MIARYVRSTCRQSSEIGEFSSLLDMYCTLLLAALQTLPLAYATEPCNVLCVLHTLGNFTGKHIAKRHLTGNYSSTSTIWLV